MNRPLLTHSPAHSEEFITQIMRWLWLFYSDMMKQGLALARRPHIVIATPGRLADHLQNTQTISFKRIKFLVSEQGREGGEGGRE